MKKFQRKPTKKKAMMASWDDEGVSSDEDIQEDGEEETVNLCFMGKEHYIEVMDFDTPIHYDKLQKAFESLMDDSHKVMSRYLSIFEEKLSMEKELDFLKKENHSLKNEVDSLKQENDFLKKENEAFEEMDIFAQNDCLSNQMDILRKENEFLKNENLGLKSKPVALSLKIAEPGKKEDPVAISFKK